jgi:hypothetical protein
MQKRIIQCTKCQVLQSDNGFPSCKECGAKLYKENSKMNSTDQSQQPTAREMLEALIEYYDNNKRWFLSSSRRSGVEYKGLTGIALLEFAEQWLKEKTKER